MDADEEKSIESLVRIAARIRTSTINSLYTAQSGHLGPSLSIVELLTALYFSVMRLGRPESIPDPCNRDLFVLSKGHAAPSLYATLAERGLIEKQLLSGLRAIESPLQGHPEKHRLAFIDATTGSLGQGISMAQGYAIGQKLRGNDFRTYCIVGDGECQEGQVWEAAMSARKFELDNMVCIVDCNKFQNEESVADTMPVDSPPIHEKWSSFGWRTEVIDGHDFPQILGALSRAQDRKGLPTVIIANTVKGKGISFAEGNPVWHSKVIDRVSYERAIAELEAVYG
jgi:transketolase